MNIRRIVPLLAALTAALAGLDSSISMAQDHPAENLGYDDTPFLPGGQYRVHDGTRPQPEVVEPGTASTPEDPGKPPSDAVILFDGGDLSAWEHPGGGAADWKVEDGVMEIAPRTGAIQTKQAFGDCQLHLEFATPEPASGSGQGRGNSGVMFFGRYEIQLLDSFENPTYPDGQAGAVYGQRPPLVNASRPPGQWQTYDIFFTAPRFDEDGAVERPAYVTILHNGVLVQHHTPILGAVAFRALASYQPHGSKGPLMLQDHGNPIRFRNIWIREIPTFGRRIIRHHSTVENGDAARPVVPGRAASH